MQTFLPYPSFEKSAGCLDYRRLGKQRVEAKQIINAIVNGTGWRNHPVVKMWQNNIDALMFYHDVVIKEWIGRGYKNNMPLLFKGPVTESLYPSWFGNKEFHISHQSNLVRKNPTYYRKYFPDIPDDLPYKWIR
ncbi:MAG: MSMEG_6728 family protein [Nanoarchaeota archaeon]